MGYLNVYIMRYKTKGITGPLQWMYIEAIDKEDAEKIAEDTLKKIKGKHTITSIRFHRPVSKYNV